MSAPAVDVLKKVPIFAELDDDVLKKLAPILQRRTYQKNSFILYEEDLGDSLFIIQKGQVKITRVSEDGREVILSILGEGEFFGEMALLDGEARSANVISMGDAQVCLMKRPDFLSLLKRYPGIGIALLRELAGRIRKSDRQIESLSLSGAEQRVASTILRLAEEIGVYQRGSVIVRNLPLQQDMANMAGSSRETISRMLKQLTDKGYISRKRRVLTIHDYESFRREYAKAK